MALPDIWHEPVRWLMMRHEHETLSYFVDMVECPKCGAKPGESCVTVIAYDPDKPAGRETPHHSPRVKRGHIGWNAYKGACKVDPEMKELEKQVRSLSIQVARARRITALQELVEHLSGQLSVLVAEGWDDKKAVGKLKRSLKKAQTDLDKLSPPEEATS